MTAGLAIPNFPTLIVISAIGYAVAAVGMKLASQSQSPLSIALVVAGFAVATLAEMVLLREGNLAMIYTLPPDARLIVSGMSIEYRKKARGTITATSERVEMTPIVRRRSLRETLMAGRWLIRRWAKRGEWYAHASTARRSVLTASVAAMST